MNQKIEELALQIKESLTKEGKHVDVYEKTDDYLNVNINDILFKIRLQHKKNINPNAPEGYIFIETVISNEITSEKDLKKAIKKIDLINRNLKSGALYERDCYIFLKYEIPYSEAAYKKFLGSVGLILSVLYEDYNEDSVRVSSSAYNS